MRIVLHTGKGGVGKTTIAAATAVTEAARGARTLLVSTDPAHSVGAVLGMHVGPEPGPVPGAANLFAAHLDTRARFEQHWSAVRDYLVGVLAARGMAEVQAEELTMLPGADEVLALLELRRLAASGRFDVLIVDCAPTGETLRLLALPETVAFYAGRLVAAPGRMLRTLAASFVGTSAPAPGGEVRDAVGELLAELAAARRLLADPEVTSIRLVLTAEQVVVAEARRLFTALSLHGYAVTGVVVNRLLPAELGEGGGPAGAFLLRQRTAQTAALAAARESFAGLQLQRAPMTPTEPVGVAKLRELAAASFGAADPLPPRGRTAALSVDGGDGAYTMRLPLPLVERGEVALSRSGDDVVVTVGEFRRRITLPSLLRRCDTVGARFETEGIAIDFVADPTQWPASLQPTRPALRQDLAGAG